MAIFGRGSVRLRDAGVDVGCAPACCPGAGVAVDVVMWGSLVVLASPVARPDGVRQRRVKVCPWLLVEVGRGEAFGRLFLLGDIVEAWCSC